LGADLSLAAGTFDCWFPPGGIVDIVARLIGQWLSERLGQPFVIENRAGAGSNIATELVTKAQPDSYTLLLVSSVNAWNTAIYDNALPRPTPVEQIFTLLLASAC
jgi:tripartite-type tricarboxylate transporter receptor subunit TctC